MKMKYYNSPPDHIEIQINSLGPVMRNHFGHSRICFDQGAAESRQMYTIKNNGTFRSIQGFSMVTKGPNLSTENFHHSSYRLHPVSYTHLTLPTNREV